MLNKIKSKTYKLLRQSEKYTKTDMVYLSKGSFWLTLGQGVASLSSFFLAIAFANLLPKEIYGQYKFILSIAALLSIPTLKGMDQSLTRAIAQGYEGSFMPVLKIKLKWGFLGSLSSLVVAGYYFYQDNIALTITFLIAAVFIPFFHGLAISGSFLNGKKLFQKSTYFKIILNLITTGSVIATIFFTNNIFVLILVYFFSYSIVRLAFILFILAKYELNKKHDPDTLNYGKHLSLINIFSIIAGNIDKILLWHFLGAVPLAIYSFALAPLQQVRKVISNINPLALPKLAQRPLQEIKKTLPNKAFKMFIIILPLVIIYILLAPYLYKLIFPEYIESVFYSQIFALILLFQPTNLLKTTFTAHAHKRKIYLLNISAQTFKLLSFLILVPLFGLLGAIITFLATQSFSLLLTLWLFQRIKT